MLSATPVKLNGRKASTFYHEVINGLRAENKYLSSKYFYDKEGDKLFQQIMACPGILSYPLRNGDPPAPVTKYGASFPRI